MSTERRWDQRGFALEESTTLNDGARTIFVETMSPGTAVPPHFHDRFSETFELIRGSMSVFKSTTPDLAALETSSQPLEIGKKVTVTPGVYHQYRAGEEMTVLRCILEPGDRDFERLLMVMNGLAKDGELEKMGDSVVLMTVVMELGNAHLIGPAKEMLDGVRAEKKDEVEKLRSEVLAKYDTEENLKELLAKAK